MVGTRKVTRIRCGPRRSLPAIPPSGIVGGASLWALRQNGHVRRHPLEPVVFRQLRREDEHCGTGVGFHIGQARNPDDVDPVAQGVKGPRDLARESK
jgi:hypothetical protein